ncbi:hypothetical protein [Pelagicoccus albus]|uniref:Uncharacterized protein n=1 Tax=Pelagicoccus albus TaxID=415222 RepID=A0A7X1B3F6_9BACT|nr:hypothetical protein [Pelagicoccus albus]MBC2604802.1 hypothetical protein [Pelagicoccus albus]
MKSQLLPLIAILASLFGLQYSNAAEVTDFVKSAFYSIDGISHDVGLTSERTGRSTLRYESNYGYSEGKITTTAKRHFHSLFLKNLEEEIEEKEWILSNPVSSPEDTLETETFLISAKRGNENLDLFVTVFFPMDQTVRVSYTEVIKD